MLLLTGIKNTRGHYAHKKFYVIQPVTRVDSDLSSYDMIEWPEEQKCMRLTVRSGETKDVLWMLRHPSEYHQEDSHQEGTVESPMVEMGFMLLRYALTLIPKTNVG